MKQRAEEHPGIAGLVCTLAALVLLLPAGLVSGVLPEPWPLPVFTLLASLILAADAFAVRWLILPALPAAGDSVILPAETLMSGALRVKGVLAPETLSEQANLRAGPSILMLAHAAGLLPQEEREGDALLTAAEGLRVNISRLRSTSPCLLEKEIDGVLWHVYRDGRGLRGYASGDAAGLLPRCTRIKRRAEAPMTGDDRTALLAQLDDARAVCFVTSEFTGEQPGEICWLGAFLLDEEMAPDAPEETEWLRQRGYTVCCEEALPEAIAEQLALTVPDPEHSFYYIASDPSDRISRHIRRAEALTSRVTACMVQCILLLQFTCAACMIAGLYHLTLPVTAIILMLMMPLCLSETGTLTHSLKPRLLARLAVCGAVSCAAAACGALYASACRIEGSTAALMVLLPFLCRCAIACAAQMGVARRWQLTAAAAVGVLVISMALGGGMPLLGMGFGLSLGAFAAVLGYLVSGLC